ncbi:MAG: hypothetical protein IJ455_05945 [Agathobacter sp.]|nr:hypothetical protein [Agathobacter sp.]
MKKLLMLIISSIIMFSIVACGQTKKAEATHYGVEAKGLYFEELEEMEGYSDLIIRGERLEEEEAVITLVNGSIASGYTFSKVKILEIYQDDSGEYNVGDEITILENEVYDETNNVVYHIGGYNMMVAGDEYLLFLYPANIEDFEYFVASGVECGTISLKEDGRQTAYTTRNGNQVIDYSAFQDLWNDAIEKYIK